MEEGKKNYEIIRNRPNVIYKEKNERRLTDIKEKGHRHKQLYRNINLQNSKPKTNTSNIRDRIWQKQDKNMLSEEDETSQWTLEDNKVLLEKDMRVRDREKEKK